MLHAISWKEYFTLMGLGLLVYYGWWLVRFYPGLRLGRTDKAGRGRPVLPEPPKMVKGEEAGKPVVAAAGEVIGKPDQAGTAEGSQLLIFPAAVASETGAAGGSPDEGGKAEIAAGGGPEQLPVPAVAEKPVLLPVLAGDLRNAVQALVQKASETNMVEGELVFAFHQLLTKEPNNRLKGTHFEKKISEQIVSDLERHGPVRVDAEVVSGWWK
jgi:hypothetical protein